MTKNIVDIHDSYRAMDPKDLDVLFSNACLAIAGQITNDFLENAPAVLVVGNSHAQIAQGIIDRLYDVHWSDIVKDPARHYATALRRFFGG